MDKAAAAPPAATELNLSEQLIAPIAAQAGLYLESVQLKSAGKYRSLIVTVDLAEGPGAVDSEQIAQFSREISAALDAADPISGAYTLEVTTPGAERELTELRHYSRAIGHLAWLALADGTELTARIVALGEAEAETTAISAASGIIVTPYAIKNKQRVALTNRFVSFDEIKRARIVVEM